MIFMHQKANIRDKKFPCNLLTAKDSARFGDNFHDPFPDSPAGDENQGNLRYITGESLNLGP